MKRKNYADSGDVCVSVTSGGTTYMYVILVLRVEVAKENSKVLQRTMLASSRMIDQQFTAYFSLHSNKFVYEVECNPSDSVV
jgi:hypothetical protein